MKFYRLLVLLLMIVTIQRIDIEIIFRKKLPSLGMQ